MKKRQKEWLAAQTTRSLASCYLAGKAEFGLSRGKVRAELESRLDRLWQEEATLQTRIVQPTTRLPGDSLLHAPRQSVLASGDGMDHRIGHIFDLPPSWPMTPARQCSPTATGSQFP